MDKKYQIHIPIREYAKELYKLQKQLDADLTANQASTTYTSEYKQIQATDLKTKYTAAAKVIQSKIQVTLNEWRTAQDTAPNIAFISQVLPLLEAMPAMALKRTLEPYRGDFVTLETLRAMYIAQRQPPKPGGKLRIDSPLSTLDQFCIIKNVGGLHEHISFEDFISELETKFDNTISGQGTVDHATHFANFGIVSDGGEKIEPMEPPTFNFSFPQNGATVSRQDG